MKNTLYYGDNLEVLRKYIPDECVDLVYLDPPFNSNQDYNVLFRERDGAQSHAQVKAFEDTWTWDQEAALAYTTTVEGGGRVADMLRAMNTFLGQSDMMAYLSMMAPRLQELHRVIKASGSLYLHCDSTASHYLKLLLDAIFSPENFRNEIIWRRTNSHNNSGQFGKIHDSILFYSKSDKYYFSQVYRPYFKFYVQSQYRHSDDNGIYRLSDITGAGVRTGDSGKPWKGYDPTPAGRHWAIPSVLYDDLSDNFLNKSTLEKLDELFNLGRIRLPQKDGGQPSGVRYLKTDRGNLLQDIWAYQPFTEGLLYGSDEAIDEDVKWLSTGDMEKLGYPTQKPEGLLERIIKSSCPDDGIVMDPFCGCGTTISVAHRLNRTWLGIDITHLAITLIRARLKDAYGDIDYNVIGEPTSLSGARELALQDRFQFQWWALGKIGCRPLVQKKGADHGIDGRIFFHDEVGTITKSKQIIISVKSGGVSVKDVRDLAHVVQREKAEIGVLLTLEPATKPMIAEAAGEGFYSSPLWGEKYPRLQVLTIEQILAGEKIKSPQYRADDRVKVAPKITVEKKGKQLKLNWSEGSPAQSSLDQDDES